MKHPHFACHNREQCPVRALALSKNKLTNLGLNKRVFVGERTSFRKVRQRFELDLKSPKPLGSRERRSLRHPQKGRPQILLRGRRDHDAIRHAYLEILNSRRSSSKTSATGCMRPAAASA